MTNLRLPGQYDERVFQQAGLNLQGPYYNWNRWYLPSVGRYLEPDAIAMIGGFSGRFGPDWWDWYGYALANPLRFYDPLGLTTWPGAGPVTSPYGPRGSGFHYGMDIGNPLGGPVVASDGGTVISVAPGPNGENQVIILNDDGSVSGYAHLVQGISVGDHVDEGQVIG